MASREVYRIEIPIETTDRYSEGLRRARRDVSRFEAEASRMQRRMENMRRQRWELTIRAIDRASRVISSVSSFAQRVTNRSYRIAVRAVDYATRPLRSIASSITSILATAGIVGGVAGGLVLPIKMTIESQNITTAFEVLLGSAEAANQRIEELIEFAGQTPYTRDEIFQASRVLEVFTKGALSTGEGLRMVGDIAAGTQQDFGNVALWMGRLYDAMASGRPVGEMTSRLQEMGAISGDARARIEALAESGGKINDIWPRVTKEFERYDGMMKKMSDNLANLLLGVKSFFMNNVISRWGSGLEKALSPALSRFREWRKENSEGIQAMGDAIEHYGEKFAQFFVDHISKGASYLNELFFSDKYKDLTLGAKLKIMIDDAQNTFSEWWERTGRAQVTGLGGKIGTTFGEMINGAIMAVFGADSERDNTIVSAGFEAGSSFVKGFFDGLNAGEIFSTLGKKLLDINVAGITDPFKGEGFGSTAGALVTDVLLLGVLSKLLSPLKLLKTPAKWVGDIGRWGWNQTVGRSRGRRSVGDGRRSRSQTSRRAEHRQERRRAERERMRRITTPTWDLNRTATEQPTTRAGRAARNQRWYQKLWQRLTRSPGSGSNLGISSMGGMSRGLSRIPFLRTGLSLLSLGTASEEEMPGLIGSIAGGFAGAKGGALAGAAIGSVIPGVGTAVGGAVGGLIGGIGGSIGGEWLGNQWDAIKEKASDAASWVSTKFNEAKETLSSTLFSGEWWGGKWEEVKQTATSTVFNGGWWAEQVGFVYGYLESSLFSADWWSGKWEEVKAWTSEKWSSATEIWNNTVSNIGETLFNGEWWVGNWESVKSWASDTVNSFSDVWSSAKSLAESTLFSADWWSGKWSQVKSWASSAWENIKSGFSLGRSEGQSSASVKKYASGGLITRPHLGLVGEAGPEMIIPLSSGRRNRALELYRRAGQMLGVRQFADGGLVGSGISTPLTPTGQSAVGGIYFGDINIYPVVSVEVSGDGDLSAISDEIVDEVGVKLADKVMEALGNMFINAK